MPASYIAPPIDGGDAEVFASVVRVNQFGVYLACAPLPPYSPSAVADRSSMSRRSTE